MDSALNNLQRLICHKTKQTKPFFLLEARHYIIEALSAGAVEYADCISVEGYTPHECSDNDTKLSDGEAPVQEFWGKRNTFSLPSLPGPLWQGVVAPHRVPSMD